jgi:hypothetical protein
MAKNIDRLAGKLGAKVIAKIPDVGDGAFGASRLAAIVRSLQSRLKPGEGLRPSYPMQMAAQLFEEAVAALPEG